MEEGQRDLFPNFRKTCYHQPKTAIATDQAHQQINVPKALLASQLERTAVSKISRENCMIYTERG